MPDANNDPAQAGADSDDRSPQDRPDAPGFGQALAYWFKLGWISFGGPAGQIAIMHEDVVKRRRWISEGRFLHALNYCMVLPGPEAQQLATYIGWLLHGKRGGIAAGVLFVLPSLLILCTLSWVYLRWGEQPMVSAVLDGVKPAVVAIVLAAAWRLGARALRHRALWAIAVAALVAVAVFDVPFPAVILGAAVAGVITGRLWPSAVGGASHGPARMDAAPRCVIDDADPPPPHAAFRLRRSFALVAVFVAIWAASIAILAASRGVLGDTGLQLAWFHTKAALLTFGGAYAVLPYVYQAAVEHYQWLSATQMIDGLALGETTPGPLIMVVAYVGFLAGWLRQMLGPEALFAAGALGASIATLFTFLPSFLFILAGGPFIEGTRQQIRLQAPLTGITAAVVGVIVSLALFFARHVLLRESGGVDWLSVAITCVSLIALTRGRRGVVEVIAAAGLVGLAAALLR